MSVRLSHLVNLQNGFPFASEDFDSTGQTPLVRIRDLSADDFETYLPFSVPDSQAIEDGDLVVGMDGEFSAQIWNRGHAALNQRLARLRSNGNSDIRYVAYALPKELQRIHDTQFATTVKHLSSGEILQCRVPDRPVDEQRRIADFLDDRVSRIDRIIAARREQIASSGKAFDAWWDSSMRRMGQLNDVVPMRRVLTSIADGPFGSSLTSQHYADSGTRVIRLGNIGVAAFRNDDHAFIPDDYAATLANNSASEGDLVMAGLGDDRWPLGRCAVVPDIGPAIVKADCYRIRLQPIVSHEFAAIALSSPHVRSRLAMLGRGATRARLNTEVAREAPLVLVTEAEQAAYTSEWNERRDDVEQMRKGLGESIDLLTEYKSSLITAAVTGELDVSTAGSSILGVSPSE